MVKTYSRIDWENEPSTKTPVNETNLNKMDAALNEIDNRVVSLDTTKASVSDVNGLVASIEFNEDTGVFTVTKKDGSKATFDTKLEKIAVNFEYEPTTQKLIIYLDDGTTQEVDLSAFVTQYEFTDGDIITWSVVDGKVTANIKENSIPGNKLEPNYLVNCITAKNEAQAAAGSANTSKTLAESYAHGGTGTREGEDTDNAEYYMKQARDIVGGNFIVKPDNPKEGDALIFDGENWVAQTQEQVDVITYGETELEDDVSDLASGTMYCQLIDGQIAKAWIGIDGIAKPLNVGGTPTPTPTQIINYTFLYDRGDEHIDLTGGWVAKDVVGGAIPTKQADCIETSATTKNQIGYFRNTKEIVVNENRNYWLVYDLIKNVSNTDIQVYVKSGVSDWGSQDVISELSASDAILKGVFKGDYPTNAKSLSVKLGAYSVKVYNILLTKTDNIQPLADGLGVSATIDAILAKSTELLAGEELVNYMVYNCTGDFMLNAIRNNDFLLALNKSAYAQKVLNNEHWAYFLDMVGFIYNNGNKLYLYNEGAENTAITGGWLLTGTDIFKSDVSIGNGTVTKEASTLTIASTSLGYGKMVGVSKNKKIKVGNDTKLKYELTSVNTASQGYNDVCVGTKLTTSNEGGVSAYIRVVNSGTKTSAYPSGEVDLTSFGTDTEVYIGFTLYSLRNTLTDISTTISKVWLE